MINIHNFIIITLLMSSSSNLLAEIYKWRDENGNLHISDKPPEKITPTEIHLDDLLRQSGGVELSKPQAKPLNDINQDITPEQIPEKPKKDSTYTTRINQHSTLLSSCTKRGPKKCFYPKDETICILRYGASCHNIHFWKEIAKQAYKRRSGEIHENPYFILANRPMGLIELHLDKTIPTHKNTSRKNLKCLLSSGFFCDELSNNSVCQQEYDLSCTKLRTWKEDAIKRCENSHGVKCDTDEYLKNYRPLSIEEYNRNSNVIGSQDSFLLNYNFLKNNKKQYNAINKILLRLDGR